MTIGEASKASNLDAAVFQHRIKHAVVRFTHSLASAVGRMATASTSSNGSLYLHVAPLRPPQKNRYYAHLSRTYCIVFGNLLESNCGHCLGGGCPSHELGALRGDVGYHLGRIGEFDLLKLVVDESGMLY